MLRLTTAAALAMDVTDLADELTEACSVRLTLTDAEVAALRFLGDLYTVSWLLSAGLETDDDGNTSTTFSPYDIGEALRDEGIDRVPCLSNDTGLQRVVWAIGPNQ
mgnify:CR=1 FL=1|tara:strand:+ start:1839 stop:2156 length:318 start_codon:yes stop_codon:yes gene_type:complete